MSDKEPDKTGARNPNLPPDKQGITQDEANKAGDLRDPANVADLANIARSQPGDTRELGEGRMGEHNPPEAAELGGAKTSPEASGQVGGGGGEQQQGQQAKAASRSNREAPQNKG